MKDYDWAKIETEYITGSESLRALASRFGMSYNAIGIKSKEGAWVQKRRKYQAELVSNAVQKTMRTREEEIVSTLELADLIDATIREIISDPDRVINLASTKQPGKELEAMAKAISSNEELRRMCRGIMAPRDAERLKLDREKWEAEVKKAETETDKAIRVVLEGDLDKWAE